MFIYHIKFPKYQLREYERKLALMELNSLLPTLTRKWTVSARGIHIQTRNHIDESILKKLVFFSSVSCTNVYGQEVDILTDQSVAEHYSNGRKISLSESCLSARTSREIRYLSHSLHEYKGRFYPQIVGSLLNCAEIASGDTVLDPFSGCGTTLVESRLRGIDAIGLDVNPLAVMISKAKIASLCMSKATAIRAANRFSNFSDNDSDWKRASISNLKIQPDVDYLENWFPRDTLRKIFFLMEKILSMRSESSRLLCQTVLSNLLRKFSYQSPSDLRIRRRKDTPPFALISDFNKNLEKQVESIINFQKSTLDKERVKKCYSKILHQDSRFLIKGAGIQPNSVDIIITSPPYATALPYIDTDRLSLVLFGYGSRSTIRTLENFLIGNREISTAERDRTDRKLSDISKSPDLPDEIISLIKTVYTRNKEADVGFRRRNLPALLYKYFIDMNTVISQMKVVLKKGKKAYIVVGQNATTAGGVKIVIPTDDYIALIAERNGFKVLGKMDMAVQKSYTIYSKNAINKESIIMLQKR